LDNFTNIVEVIMPTRGSIGNHEEIIEAVSKEKGVNLDEATAAELKSMTAIAKERYLAVAFLLSSD